MGLKERAPDISVREQGGKATGISASSAAWPFRGRVAEGKKLTGGVRLSAEAAGAGRWAGVRERGAERGAGCGPGDARARGSGACFAGCGPVRGDGFVGRTEKNCWRGKCWWTTGRAKPTREKKRGGNAGLTGPRGKKRTGCGLGQGDWASAFSFLF